MPIIIKDFKWKQSETVITVYIPLKIINSSKADIFTAKSYIKISYEQYFFELFLLHEINPKRSSCIISEDEVIFQLEKCQENLWDKLEPELSRSEKNELKKEIIAEAHEIFQKEEEEKENKKHELKRVAVREQIALDTKQREMIDKIRQEEKERALGDFENWRQEAKITELPEDYEEDDLEDLEEIEFTNEGTKNTVKRIESDNVNKSCEVPKQQPPAQFLPRKCYKRSTLGSSENVSIPLPRKQSTLAVTFTERAFPTPSRESKLEEEQEWLQKQLEAHRSVGFASEDLRPEEKNPLYVKAKGDSFMKAKNYLAAISAYTFAIKLSEKFVDLYISRSEAHFALEHYQKAVRDCSTALDLLKPAVSSNLHQRMTCIVRRGESLCRIGMYREGIGELEAGLALQPDNDVIRMKIEKEMIEYRTKMKEEQEKERKKAEKETEKEHKEKEKEHQEPSDETEANPEKKLEEVFEEKPENKVKREI